MGMPNYFFCVRTPDKTVHRADCHDLPNLEAALATGSRTARALVRNPVRQARTVRGSLDIEDERRQPVARLMLAEVARQIS